MKRHWKLAWLVSVLMTSLVNSSIVYVPGEHMTRGTSVIISSAFPSKIMCAGACSAESECVGFNWKSSPPSCGLLSSLIEVVQEAEWVVYVPDISRTSVKLEYACPDCAGSPPGGLSDWEMDCSLPGEAVAVGVGFLTSLEDLDYLLCAKPQGMTMTFADAGVFSFDAICPAFFSRPFVVTALWSSQQYFHPPTSMRYQCRLLISGEKFDPNRCMTPMPKVGVIPGVDGSDHLLLMCPPHMVAAHFFWDQEANNLKFTCCFFYKDSGGP